MSDTFGKKLRDLRVNSDIGLRELARLINKSPGYLSDVERDHVPPPSEDVILKIAEAMNADKKELLAVAQKMDPEISNYVAQEPEAADFLRMAKDKEFDHEDWERLSKVLKNGWKRNKWRFVF